MLKQVQHDINKERFLFMSAEFLLPGMRISYSALDVFQRCPLQYKFQYLDRIKTPKSKDAIFGTLIHSALRLLHEPNKLMPPTEEEMLAFFSQNWDPTIFSDQREEATFFAQGVQILKNYYAKNSPSQFNIVALESLFEAPILIGQEQHIITGKIDRVDKIENDIFEVIDYKTTKKMPSQKNVDNDLQLAVYHLGVTSRWPSLKQEERPVKVSLYYLKHGEKLSSIKNNQNLQETQEKISRLIEQIEKAQAEEKFNPMPSVLCDWCAYQRYCPLFKHKFKEEKIFFNDQDVKALIDEHISLKDEIEQKKKRLTEIQNSLGKFMDQENMERLFSEDGYITRKLIQRFKYNLDLLKEILEPLGKWEGVLKVDDAKLKKIIKELPENVRQKTEEAKKVEKEDKRFSVSKTRKTKSAPTA
ncbi:MAG: PD-(D/E)XK nuclease family protein [Candidatus Portnoybacteria bacterium]|nr:PD-(D/E)XK nuclease family protein [Candidatus Portnoybacteria bacterium]